MVKFVDSKNERPDHQLERILSNGGRPKSSVYSGLDSLYFEVASSTKVNSGGNSRVIVAIIILLHDPLPIRELACLLLKSVGEIKLHLQELQ